jgi:putative phosphoesterase
MVVAILSDSHGRVDAVRRALDVLAPFEPAAYFHCGDVGGLEVFDQFVGKRFWFVWGNTDRADAATYTYLQTVGLPSPNGPVCVTLDGKSIAVFHGHERQFKQACRQPSTDYIFHGHTHSKADHRVGRTRVINPGALHRAAVRTVATLNLATDDLQFHVIA